MSDPSATLDPNMFAVRDDLADVELADRVFAPHYAQALSSATAMATKVHLKPNPESAVVDTLAAGVAIDLFDLSGGWGWVRTAKGIGYVPAEAIAPA